MKDERAFSNDKPPLSASDQERSGESDGHVLPSPPTVPQDVPASAHPPKAERQLTPRRHVRLFLVAMVVMVLVVLGGGYGAFRSVSPTPRQTTSAFQQAHCPFRIGAGLVEGQNVKCGELTVPEDRSQPRGSTIELAVGVFKTPASRLAPDPVLVLGGGPGNAQLVHTGPLINASNLARVTAGRDFILLDQRGEGYSLPSLSCLANETLQACHIRLVNSGINRNTFKRIMY